MPERPGNLRVLMVSTSYPKDLQDWRGLFIRQLVTALARREDLGLRIWSPPGEYPATVESVARPEESSWLTDLIAAGGIAHILRTGGLRRFEAPIQLVRMLRNVYRRESGVDVYHVNWLQNALGLPRNGRPLLAAVLGTDMQLLKVPGMASVLRLAFQHRNVAICPNADWMVPELERRFGDIASIRLVPFGVEPCWFQIKRYSEASAKWLCVSRLTKGKIGNLFEWCAPLFSKGDRELHLFGPMQETIPLPTWTHYHGAATPEMLCEEWFPKAAGLITLSQHAEGRPQVMLEAMAAGLPIIASDTPAHADLLTHRQTGWLCRDASQVGEALDFLSNESENATMGLRAKSWVRENIGTWDDCAARYHRIYRELIS